MTVTVAWCVTFPLVPSTLTEYEPVVVVAAAQTVSVEVPEFMIVVGVRVAVKPDGVPVVRAIEPVNPPREITVIVFDVHPPCATVMELGLAVTWKSRTFTVTIALREMDPSVPVTVTTYDPPTPVHVRVLDPDPPDTLAGLVEHERPVDGNTELVNETLPVKPLSGVIVTVDVTETSGVVVTKVGLANIWKSTTWTIMKLVCDSEPLVPAMVTL